MFLSISLDFLPNAINELTEVLFVGLEEFGRRISHSVVDAAVMEVVSDDCHTG